MHVKDYDLTIALYAIESDGASVRADVFASKMQAVVQAINKADKIANQNNRTATLVVDDLQYGSAIVSFRERVKSKGSVRVSGAALLMLVMEAISVTPSQLPEEYKNMLPKVVPLVSDVEKKFSHAVISGRAGNTIRIDGYFAERLKIAQHAVKDEENMFFSGVENGAFDGSIKLVDTRGDINRGKIILTAGGKEVDCIFSKEMLPIIKESISQRVSVFGMAYYSPSSLLPDRIEIKSIDSIKMDADLTRWKSSFDLSGIEDSWGDE